MLKDDFCQEADVLGVGPRPRFIVSGEISSIYKKNGKVRKVHNLILLPSLEDAEALSHQLEAIGNLHSDGRPILGLDSRDLLEITLDVCPDAMFIPAHIWTPHFSLFGAYSGFDDIKECFEDLTDHIHALETGLSSDPPMNWRLSALDKFTLVSNSDAHSPANLAREANLFDTAFSYPHIAMALQDREAKGFYGTIEFFPEEGKYHYDGHRNCQVRFKPTETQAASGICPVCGGRITVGVLHRVEALADRAEGFVPPAAKHFESLVPLQEVIAASTGLTAASVKVREEYNDLLHDLGPELFILREAPLGDIEREAGSLVAEGIHRLRLGKVEIEPGYDGQYGKIKILDKSDIGQLSGQLCFLNEKKRGRSVPQGVRDAEAKNLRGSFAHLLVDEFQDINMAQYRLIKEWGRDCTSIFVIGDPDQSIYGFRGSDPRCFERFFEDFPCGRQIRLTQNYRSTPEIIRCAQAVIAKETAGRHERALEPKREGGFTKVRLLEAADEFSEALCGAKEINRMVGGIDMLDAHSSRKAGRKRPASGPARGFSDIAVLYRTNRQADVLEQCLLKEGIPYVVAGRDEFLAEPQIRRAIAFFRFLLDPEALVSLRLCLEASGAYPADLVPKVIESYAASGKNVMDLVSILESLQAPQASDNKLAGLLRKYGPLVHKEEPQELLEAWISDNALSGLKCMELLVNTAVVYESMSSLLQNLLLGRESDLVRSSGRSYRPDAVSLMTLHGAKGLKPPSCQLLPDRVLVDGWANPLRDGVFGHLTQRDRRHAGGSPEGDPSLLEEGKALLLLDLPQADADQLVQAVSIGPKLCGEIVRESDGYSAHLHLPPRSCCSTQRNSSTDWPTPLQLLPIGLARLACIGSQWRLSWRHVM